MDPSSWLPMERADAAPPPPDPPAPVTVVFDLDDTLCDYAGARSEALTTLGATLGDRADPFLRAYLEFEPALFRSFLDGGLPLESYRLERFARPLRCAGIDGAEAADLAGRLNAEYMRRCNEDVRLFDDALPALRRLRAAGAALALLTNGPADGQRTKLRCLGIERSFDGVFVSGETGFAKPDDRAFELVERALPSPRRVMIGDSLQGDVLPAVARGWEGILIRRAGPTGDPAEVTEVTGLRAAVDRVLQSQGA